MANIIIIIIYYKPGNFVHRIVTVRFYFCVNYYNFVGFLFISCENKINYVKMNCSICSSLLGRKEPEKNNIYSFSAYCYIIIYKHRIFFHGRECSILNNNHDRETWWHKKKRINTLIIRRRSDILFWAQPCLTAESEPIFRFILCTFPPASSIFHKSSQHFQHFSYSIHHINLYLKNTINTFLKTIFCFDVRT